MGDAFHACIQIYGDTFQLQQLIFWSLLVVGLRRCCRSVLVDKFHVRFLWYQQGSVAFEGNL